jgi:hypothetical protein
VLPSEGRRTDDVREEHCREFSLLRHAASLEGSRPSTPSAADAKPDTAAACLQLLVNINVCSWKSPP